MDRSSYYCTGSGDQTITKKKKFKRAKWLSKEALQIAEKIRELKAKEKKKNILWNLKVLKYIKER